jgi:hypothetical protein
MNAIRPRILMLVAGLLLSGASARGDEEPAAEPLELTRLRQQFQHRLDQELEPWREKYRKELQKLEDRMIAERKLVEALAVKKEREANAPLSTEPAAATGSSKVPGSEDETRDMLIGTVWLVYQKDDRKRAAPVDVFHFLDAGNVYVFSRKNSFKWSAQTKADVYLQFPEGKFDINIDFQKMEGSSKFLGIDYVIVNPGSSNASRK